MKTNAAIGFAILCAICAVTMVHVYTGSDNVSNEDIEHVFAAQTPRMPVATPTLYYMSNVQPIVAPTIKQTVEPIPTYNEIWSLTSINCYLYDEQGNYIDAVSGVVEMTAPYSDYDWNDDSATIEDVVDAMGIDYDHVETVKETYSYPADDKYGGTGQYVIHLDGGVVTMSISITATRYYTQYPSSNVKYLQTFEPVITCSTTPEHTMYSGENGQNIRVGAYHIIECGYGCNIDCGHNCEIYCGRGCNIDCGDSCVVNCGNGCNIAHGERCSITHGTGCNIYLAYPD